MFIVGSDHSEASLSCYRLTENTALESIKIVSDCGSTSSDMYRSIFANLFESICSPHLWMVGLDLESVVGEVEDFPWDVVNGLAKGSPYVLRRVEVDLLLRVVVHLEWGLSIPLDPDEYESYFYQVRSALPDLDKILITRIGVRQSSNLYPYIFNSLKRIDLMSWYETQMELNDRNTINIFSSRILICKKYESTTPKP
jgi:hypothetical protein